MTGGWRSQGLGGDGFAAFSFAGGRPLSRVVVEAFGVTVAIDVVGTAGTTDAAVKAVEATVRQNWAWCLASGGESDLDAPETSVAVVVRVDAGPDEIAVLHDRLSRAVTAAALAMRVGRLLLLLHACVLADGESGRAVALVASSGTGKTTLTRALGTRFVYVTDETAAVEFDRPDGRFTVLPYPKPLSIIPGRHAGQTDHPLAVKEQIAPAALNLRGPPARSGYDLVGVALLLRDPDGSAVARVERLPLIDAIAAIAPETSSLSLLPAPLHLLQRLAATVGGFLAIHYREATSVTGVISSMLGSRPSGRPIGAED